MLRREQTRVLLAFAGALLIGAIAGLIVPISNTVLLYTVLWVALYPIARVTFLRGLPAWRHWAGLPVGLVALVLLRGVTADAPPPWFTVIVLVTVTFAALRQAGRHAPHNRARGG